VGTLKKEKPWELRQEDINIDRSAAAAPGWATGRGSQLAAEVPAKGLHTSGVLTAVLRTLAAGIIVLQ
jgi:hypothetical protein